MMDTDTHSVAEIIGWQRIPDIPGPLGGIEGGWARPETPDVSAEPTPDDMLAWLREQGCDVEINTACDATEVEVNVGAPGDEVMVPIYDSTIHEALKAAVRYVTDA